MHMDFMDCNIRHRVQIPVLPLASCVALDKLFDFSVHQFIVSVKETIITFKGVF